MKRGLSLSAAAAIAAAAILVPSPASAARVSTADLTASVSFPADVTEMATVSGTGTPGAEVFATTPKGEMAAHASVDPAGTWESLLTPPNAGGPVRLDVFEVAPDGSTQTTTTEAAFGDAVSITTPGNGATHPGGRLEFTGTGEPSARLYLNRGNEVLAAGSVEATGSWSMQATIGANDSTYEVLQIGRGANVTTDTVEITGPDGIPPLVVTSPGAGSTVVAPSGRVTFRGTGAPAATLTISEADTELASGKIGAGGTFNLTAALHNGPNALTLHYAPVGAPAQDIPYAVTVIASGR